MHWFVRVLATAGVAAAVMTGCASRPRGEQPAVVRGRPPSYAAVAAGYNARVTPLDRLWTRTVTRIWYPGEGEGEERVEQLEGTLQFIRPDKVLVTFSKLGDIYGILGSNQTRYWWIELGAQRRAWVGEHANANPERIAELGLPIHPLDFVDLAGITPLPQAAEEGRAGAGPPPRVRWSTDGRSLVVTLPGRRGRLQLTMDPTTFEPSRIEYLDPTGDGAPVVYADLSRYAPVAVGQFGQGPRIATEILVSMDHDRTRARLRLTSAESGTSRPRPGVFDLDRILEGRNVREVILLDGVEGAAVPEAGGH